MVTPLCFNVSLEKNKSSGLPAQDQDPPFKPLFWSPDDQTADRSSYGSHFSQLSQSVCTNSHSGDEVEDSLMGFTTNGLQTQSECCELCRR